MTIPSDYALTIDQIGNNLQKLLHDNLYSCILYGSTVRGNVIAGKSDINLLIVLNQSTPDAHFAIANCLTSKIKIDPFIIGRPGMKRSFEVFGLKFRSIKRHYKILHGADPIKDFSVNDAQVKYLCEQGLRNLRLRCIHNYIANRQHLPRYNHYIFNLHIIIFTYVSEILRLNNIDVPDNLEQRITLIKDFFKIDVSILVLLSAIHNNSKSIKENDIPEIHRGIFSFLHAIVTWIEDAWPNPN